MTHEPYEGADQPQVARVATLAHTKGAAVIRVEAEDFTDYAAVAFGPQPEGAEHTFFIPGMAGGVEGDLARQCAQQRRTLGAAIP